MKFSYNIEWNIFQVSINLNLREREIPDLMERVAKMAANESEKSSSSRVGSVFRLYSLVWLQALPEVQFSIWKKFEIFFKTI